MCAAWLRGESALVALACEVVGRCEVRAALGAGQLAARTHVARPLPFSVAVCVRSEKNAQGPRRGELGSASRKERRGVGRSANDERGGGAPFVLCSRSVWSCVVGVFGISGEVWVCVFRAGMRQGEVKSEESSVGRYRSGERGLSLLAFGALTDPRLARLLSGLFGLSLLGVQGFRVIGDSCIVLVSY